MKALVKNGKVTLADVLKPVIETEFDVIIKVEYAGICRTDLNVVNGRIPVAGNRILGHELCGIIVDLTKTVKEKGYKKGDYVSVNPLYMEDTESKMLGVDYDGCFAEFVKVRYTALVKLDDDKLKSPRGAFTEPVAASMGTMSSIRDRHVRICVFGKGRIAELETRILKYNDYTDVEEAFDYSADLTKYDFVVETVPSAIPYIVKHMKPNSTLICKSRVYHQFANIDLNDLIMNNKTVKGVRCSSSDFPLAVKCLEDIRFKVDDMFYEHLFSLKEYQIAFDYAMKPDSKKAFFKI